MAANEKLLRGALPKKPVKPILGTYKITSSFGWRTLFGKNDYHNGIDIVTDNDMVVSPQNGIVKMSAYGTECGNQIEILTSDNKTLFFCHMADRKVKAGAKVSRGQVIGTVGSTGTKCFGKHLHFGVYRGARAANVLINPCEYLNI